MILCISNELKVFKWVKKAILQELCELYTYLQFVMHLFVFCYIPDLIIELYGRYFSLFFCDRQHFQKRLLHQEQGKSLLKKRLHAYQNYEKI